MKANYDETKLYEHGKQFAIDTGLCLSLSGTWYDWDIEYEEESEITITFRCGIDEEGHKQEWYETKTIQKNELLQDID
jgi:hypothetical protein